MAISLRAGKAMNIVKKIILLDCEIPFKKGAKADGMAVNWEFQTTLQKDSNE
jgi:hypothetical protein